MWGHKGDRHILRNRKHRPGMRRQQRKEGRLPRNAAPIEVTIDYIGGRGDGIGRASYTHNYQTKEHSVFVPATLPGERVLAQPLSLTAQGMKTRILELIEESPHRQAPGCDAFPACGGCNFQHWSADQVTDWKHSLGTGFLQRAGVTPDEVRPMLASPMASRRRAVFHLKRLAQNAVGGFQERQGTQIVYPTGCTVLHPDLLRILDAMIQFFASHAPVGMTIDLHVNRLDRGVCVYLAGQDSWPADLMAALADWASMAAADGMPLARLSVRERGLPMMLFAPVPATLRFGEIDVVPPPGAFLQPPVDGEAALQKAVAEIVGDARIIADLFAGCGTLSLPLLTGLNRLIAAEQDPDALAALKAGADAAGMGGRVTPIVRDLGAAPLLADEMKKCDAVILDPPRAGAAAQSAALATAKVPVIAMVSCNPASFARDAATLCAAGYHLNWVQMIDQFRFTNHVELVAKFTR